MRKESISEYVSNLVAVAKHYGTEHQLKKLVEELGELQSAVARYMIDKSDINRFNLLQELADVENVTAQVALLLRSTNDVIYLKEYKMRRQLKRIKEPSECKR